MVQDSRRKRGRTSLAPVPTLVKKKARRREQVVVAPATAGGGASSSSYSLSRLRYWEDSTDSDEDASRSRYLRKKTTEEMEAAAAGIVKANKRQPNGRPSRRGAHHYNAEPVRTVVPLHYGGKSTVALTLAAGEVDADLIEMLGNTPNALLPAQESTPSPPRPPPSHRSGSGPNGKSDIDRYFVRHSGQKGWVSCVACGELQWPPNREKHLAKCPGLRSSVAAKA